MRPAATELPLHPGCRTILHPGWRTSKQPALGQHTDSPILIKTPPNPTAATGCEPTSRPRTSFWHVSETKGEDNNSAAGAEKRNRTLPSPASPQPRAGTNSEEGTGWASRQPRCLQLCSALEANQQSINWPRCFPTGTRWRKVLEELLSAPN